MALRLEEQRPVVQQMHARLSKFVQEECIPAEIEYHKHVQTFSNHHSSWTPFPGLERLKERARELGLWNVWMPKTYPEGPGFTNLEYAHMCEVMGRSFLAPEACNCSAPDTGNMEVFAKYGNAEQKAKYLKPLMDGKIRSVFLMTEPAVASSDASNIQCSIRKDGDQYVINGRKWWSSGACDPRCKVGILMGRTSDTASKYRQQSMIIVPMDAPGVKVLRHLTVFGYNDAPHGHAEVLLDNVRVPVENLLLGEGRGFEISQGRLGPGRIHHCMRSLGLAERALEAMIKRVKSRTTFGKTIAEHGTIQKDIADSRIEINACRLMVLQSAHLIDVAGSKSARDYIAAIKVFVPNSVLSVIDRAIQAHGGGGVSQDFFLAYAWASMRTLRLADGPDEVHRRTIARLEFKKSRL